MAGLRAALPGVGVMTSDDLGVPADAKEAIAFAILGWCTLHGRPGNVPAATGASGPRVLGAITPGHYPLRLPEPEASPVRSLRMAAAPGRPDARVG